MLLLAALLVLPVPSLLLDGLLLANLGFALWLSARAVAADSAEELPSLPALLVVGILLRLGLSVAAVRLLLGEAYAGRVIAFAGQILAGESLYIGGALFLLIAAVQYLVLARGGERMAEVAARFALDALPGRQQAIEADLRAGSITHVEAQARRAALESEARIYGAMDGALRLLRGDVIAGLLVLLITLVFGVGLGVLSLGLSAGEAFERYALLAVGNGLVTQLPALLSSGAAGLLLSRGGQAKAPSGSTTTAPLILVEADATSGLSEAALAQLGARLSVELGIPVPAMALRRREQPTGWLHLTHHGVTLVRRLLGPGQEALPILEQALTAAAAELLGLDEVQQALTTLERTQPALIRETVPRRIELARLTSLLKQLLKERLFPLDLRAVLEALAALPRSDAEPGALAEQLRAGLGRQLVERFVRGGAPEPSDGSPQEGLPVLLIDAEIEQLLRDSGALPLRLEPELMRDIVQAAQAAKALRPDAVLVCQADVRKKVQRLLDAAPETLPVLAYSELPAQLTVRVVGRVEPGGGSGVVDSAAQPWQLRSR